MKKKKIIIICVILLAFIVAGLVYNYTFNSKHRDIANEKASVTLLAKELFSEFQKNEDLATTNYLDKVIQLKGTVTSVEENELAINDQIQVIFKTGQMPKITNGTELTIKGRCVGYDELLEMVKIDQATIITK